MAHWDPDHYLNSPSYQRVAHFDRMMRRLYIDIKGVEPRSKNAMPDSDKVLIQQNVLDQLVRRRRRAFRGQLAVKIMLETTERTPAHPHTIVKNLLDLFGQPRTDLVTRRSALAYHDDRQIDALCVSGRHGRPTASIFATVCPLRDLLDPLAMASKATDLREEDSWHTRNELEMASEQLADLHSEEQFWRTKFGDQQYEDMERFARQRVQEPFFGRSGMTPTELAMLYNLQGRRSGFDSSRIWDDAYASSLLRIRVSEPPQTAGQSDLWKQEINARINDFRTRFSRLIDPLLVPVALEVAVRPPPPSRQNNVHDLDNILRTYMLPRVLDILKPPSDYAFAIGAKDTPPISTRIGVTRYEAWRLPPAPEGSKGFVSLAIVSDMLGFDGTMSAVEDLTDKWVNSLD
jgi:hypothetical protein